MQNKYVILKSPVKIGDYERVESYAKGLTKGEEQLLVTRDLKFFLTDGKGGYLEFKSINSGITLDEATQKLNDLNNSLSKNIEDLDTKTNSEIISLQDAVNALNLKFDSYVTTTEFNTLKAQVESNTIIATHANRDTLDKFSEDTNGNPLFNGKKIVADFDTSGIEAEIADLNNRSVIGNSLDYGMFGLSGAVAVGSEAVVPFNLTYMSNNISISNGIVTLKKGKKYEVKAQSTTNTASNNVWFTIKANSTTIGKLGWCGTVDQVSIPCTAIIECKEDTTLSIVTSNAYNIDSACAQMTYLEVIEVGRTTIIDPAEDAKMIQFQYGVFAVDTAGHNVTGVGDINFDRTLAGNMTLNPSTKGIKLNAGKTYLINYSLVGEYVNLGFSLKNITDGTTISTSQGAKGYNLGGDGHDIYTPTADCEIRLEVTTYNSGGIIRNESRIVVQEIAQPYYFNYYKDSMATSVLFDGSANTTGAVYNLTDSLDKFDYVLIEVDAVYNGVNTNSVSQRIYKPTLGKVYSVFYYESSGAFHKADVVFKTNTTFTVTLSNKYYTSNRVFRITAAGYTYDNHYQDVITTVDESTITDTQVDSDITSIWNEVAL